MTLYSKQGRSYRPATEPEILSAYGALMSARRKTKSGGPKRKLAGREQRIRDMYQVAMRDGKLTRQLILAELAEHYGVSARTIDRIVN